MKLYHVLTDNKFTLSAVFSSLHSKNYRLYFIGQGISLIGTWMQNIALSWLVYRLTGSVFLLGLIGFTSQIPNFILAPFTGVLTDRYNRLKIMTIAQVFFMLQALTMTLLVLFNLVEVWHIIVLSIVFGIISAFDAPARQSLVIDLVNDPTHLGNAIALNSALFNAARLVGPAIAGLTIAAVGEGICFLLNTLSFIAVIIALLMVKLPARKDKTTERDFSKSFNEGFLYTFRSVPIRTLIIILAVLSLFCFPFMVLLPAYAKEIMHGGSETLGFLMSGLGAGALTGALIMAGRKTVFGLGKIISVNVVVLGASVAVVAVSTNLALSLLFLFFGGFSMILSLAAANTMLQTLADEDKRGRVMSFYAMALLGTMPIGNLLAGSVASGIGLSGTMLIGGLVTVFSAIWFEFQRRSMRKSVRHIYMSKGIISSLP
ncbi:MAG: MFS transporter, partial [Bacteroidales bacterium]|nr:MFS transporter [Bacteroidales bacterium]